MVVSGQLLEDRTREKDTMLLPKFILQGRHDIIVSLQSNGSTLLGMQGYLC